MDHFGSPRFPVGSSLRNEPGKICGQADPGILSCRLQHSGLLAGAAASDDLQCLAAALSDRAECSDRCGSQRSDLSGQSLPCGASCADIEHNRSFQHCAAYPGKNDRCNAERLCAVCKDERRKRMAAVPVLWFPECAASSGDASFRFHQ